MSFGISSLDGKTMTRENDFHESNLASHLAASHMAAVAAAKPWREIWQLIVEHAWFQNKLEQLAQKVRRQAKLNAVDVEDIKQHVLLEIAAAIQRNLSLGFDADKGKYQAFMSTIVYRACLKSLRQFKSYRKEFSCDFQQDLDRHTNTNQTHVAIQDLRAAVNRLPSPYCEITSRVCAGESVDKIAADFGKSTRTLYRLIRHAVDLIRQMQLFE